MRFIFMLPVLAVASQALAAVSSDHQITTTGDFVTLCQVSEDEPTYEAAMGFCLGYVDAVMDYHAALTAGPKYDPVACPENTITREQLVAVLLDWSKSNAQHLDVETPVHGLMRAASEKWPCPGQ
jgi:hypothetical protein